MPDITWTHPFLNKVLSLIPLDSRSVLDVGCGRGIVGAICKIYRDPSSIWGIDLFDAYLEFCKSHMPYEQLIKHDLSHGLPSLNRTFDVGVSLEVIEHLEKGNGQRLLTEMERACKRVIVSTPGEFFQQDAYDGNARQSHVSLWSEKDFKDLGYSTQSRRVPGIWILGRSVKFLSSALSKFLSEAPQESWIIAYKDSAPP